MTTEQIFLVVSALVAGLIIAAGVFALFADRRTVPDEGRLQPMGPGLPAEGPARDKYLPGVEPTSAPGSPLGPDRFRTTLRAVWWASIAGILISVGVTDVFAHEVEIFALGALAVGAVVVFHELLPDRWRSPLLGAAETASAIGLLACLVVLTNVSTSPYAPMLALPAVAVALGGRPRAALGAAVVASVAYGAVLLTDPALPFAPGELLPAAVVLGLVWLLTVSAAVFAAQQRRLQAATLQLSVTDSLTGLLNRAQIFVDLDQEVRRSRRSLRPFCLLMVDMDALKFINDSLGHERGDAAIRGIASVIRRSIRTVDSAYRYAGDEFVVLLPETDFAGAFVVAEKIRQGAEELGVAFGGEETPTTVSVGLVSHPEDGSTDEELMLAVDRAMYAAKAGGKNRVSGFPRPVRVAAPSGSVSPATALG